jgi:glycerophosphoryl diester phosphodiesterase
LHVWTVDDLAVARRWIDLGVASVTTNRPGWLRAGLGR